jgi:hypothetical protein
MISTGYTNQLQTFAQDRGREYVFQAMLVKLKREGKGASVHKPPIEVDDIAIIYKSFNLDVPTDLQNKVFVDFMLFYCNRGRENLRELKKTDFQLFRQVFHFIP